MISENLIGTIELAIEQYERAKESRMAVADHKARLSNILISHATELVETAKDATDLYKQMNEMRKQMAKLEKENAKLKEAATDAEQPAGEIG